MVMRGLPALIFVMLAFGFPPAVARAKPAAPPTCPAVSLSAGLSPARRQAAAEALADACAILRSEAFRSRVLARTNWLASCGPRGLGPPVAISGAAILAAVPERVAGFELRAEDVGGVALSDLPRGWTKIDPIRFDRWTNGDRQARASLVNTLVHEMSHHVRGQVGSATYAFADRGNNRAACPRDRLVSYGLGRIAGTLWLEGHPAPRD